MQPPESQIRIYHDTREYCRNESTYSRVVSVFSCLFAGNAHDIAFGICRRHIQTEQVSAADAENVTTR